MSKYTKEGIFQYIDRFEKSKDRKIKDLQEQNSELKNEIKRIREEREPSAVKIERMMRRNSAALNVYNKWKTIQEIVKNRKSAFSLMEYLELRKVINFD